MTSRFVSGGTIAGDGHTEPQQSSASASPPRAQDAQWDREAHRKNAEWEAVQKDLEAERRRREEARKAQVEGGAGGERSLYEILQANKAAKQAAFEEQNRIRNQFRALDDDEIEFLEGVRDERRVEEERVRRETEERLARFREAQKATGTVATSADDVGGDGGGGGGGEEDVVVAWTGAGKKRKRGDKEAKSIVKGVKRRTSELEREGEVAAESKPEDMKPEARTKATPAGNTHTHADPKSSTGAAVDKSPAEKAAPGKPKPKLGLVDYGSDEDDD
ncbi:hypothetical protein F5Y05DRAFT_88985 [Hypoxylon sp. FL0543]|nr:hypothetical protein F5Y05DRAFT_88985 [Hypoxylon sp. FL0543]